MEKNSRGTYLYFLWNGIMIVGHPIWKSLLSMTFLMVSTVSCFSVSVTASFNCFQLRLINNKNISQLYIFLLLESMFGIARIRAMTCRTGFTIATSFNTRREGEYLSIFNTKLVLNICSTKQVSWSC